MRWMRLLLWMLAAVSMAAHGGCGYSVDMSIPSEAPGEIVEEADPDVIDLSHFSAEDQAAALKQGFCPIGGKETLLGSGGMKACKVTVAGREVFLCCEGCESALREDPEKYFAILDGKELPESASPDTDDEANAETPAVETPTAEAPANETPAAEAPETESPTAEAPAN